MVVVWKVVLGLCGCRVVWYRGLCVVVGRVVLGLYRGLCWGCK